MENTSASTATSGTAAAERSGFVKIPWVSRIGYGLADSSCNIVYGMINTLLTLFYTDYVGISFVTVGLVMLISRFFDGSSDCHHGRRRQQDPFALGPLASLADVDGAAVRYHVGRPVHGPADLGDSAVPVHLCKPTTCAPPCATRQSTCPLGSLVHHDDPRFAPARPSLSSVRMALAPVGRLSSGHLHHAGCPFVRQRPVRLGQGNGYVVRHRVCAADLQLRHLQRAR